jgi:hypothetical protein
MKKGQITIFIIIAGVLLAGTLAIFALKGNTGTFNPFSKNMEPYLSDIDRNLKGCIFDRSVDAIWMIGLQGGYINLPREFIQTNISKVAYGLYNGKKILPPLENIEKEISDYVSYTIIYCINESDSPEFKLSIEKPEVTTKISDKEILVYVTMPISGTNGEKSFELDNEIVSEVPIRLGLIYKTAEKIIEKQKIEKDFVPVTFLASLDQEILFSYVTLENIVYAIHDEESRVNNIPFSFLFGVKIEREEEVK